MGVGSRTAITILTRYAAASAPSVPGGRQSHLDPSRTHLYPSLEWPGISIRGQSVDLWVVDPSRFYRDPASAGDRRVGRRARVPSYEQHVTRFLSGSRSCGQALCVLEHL